MRSPPATRSDARRRAASVGWVLAAGLAGGVSETVASGKAATALRYDVPGQRHHIRASAEEYVERGIASWYGDVFHGKATASGERFDMYALTAAHRTLPIATAVEVTNLRNGKSIVVRINDRGPFADRRIIDLSYAAGQALGLVGAGTGLVEVRALSGVRKASRSHRGPPAFVQIGADARRLDAGRMRSMVPDRDRMR